MTPHTPSTRALAIALLTTLGGTALAQAPSRTLVEIRNLSASEERVAGFVLSRPQFLAVEAIGAVARGMGDEVWWGRDGDNEAWPAAAWILETTSRAVVWDMRRVTTNRLGKGLRQFTGPIRLPAGTYEVHFGSFVEGSEFERERQFEKFGITITGVGRPATPRALREPIRDFLETAFVRLLPDSAGIMRTGFELPRALEVEVVALGELRRRQRYDYGWIQNAETRQVIWTMDYQHTEPAGGTTRNRIARDTLHLPAGKYVATFVSDGSHRPGDWQAMPPYDPAFWGLTLRVPDLETRRAITTFAWQPVPEGPMIVRMTGMGDRESRSQGFALRRPLAVRIYAMGECSNLHGEIDDGAWLMDITHQVKTWEMRCSLTQPAGGAEKNRLVDTLLQLQPGSYMLYYKSDGSHSARGWNGAAPAEPQYWGVSLFPANGQLPPGIVGPPERDTTGIIAELTRMRSDRQSRRFFSLESATPVRIHALGESTGGEMDDYGWIENGKTGEKVWTMEPRFTRPAGGADKNRMADTTITLPAGRYVLYYKTDGSHAFGDWNSDPPDDPDGWGVVVRRAQ